MASSTKAVDEDNDLVLLRPQDHKWANEVIKQMSKLNERIEAISSTLNDVQRAMEVERLAQEKKWAERDENYNERTKQLEIEMRQMMSQLSAEMSNLKEKFNEPEVSKTRVRKNHSSAQEVYNSIIIPKVQYLQRVSEYYKEKPAITWIVSHMKKLIKESYAGKELESKVFPLTGYPFGVRAKITLDSGFVQFSISYIPLNESIAEGQIVVKPIPNISISVKDQSGAKEANDCIRTTPYIKNKREFNSYYTVGSSVAKNLVNSPLHILDDKWIINIHVEAPEVAQSVYSHDGTLTWAIDDFQMKKQMEMEGLIEYHVSPYFYTSPNGNRLQVHAYVNGYYGYKNKGVSMYVVLLDGVHNENNENYLKYNTTVTIFHPTHPHRNISKSQEGYSKYGYLFDLGSQAEIESFLYNDTLYYEVTVEIVDKIMII